MVINKKNLFFFQTCGLKMAILSQANDQLWLLGSIMEKHASEKQDGARGRGRVR